MMNYGGPGRPGMGMGMPAGPMTGYGQMMGPGAPINFGGIAQGIGDWWGGMGGMDKAQIIGGALSGVGSYLTRNREMGQRDREQDFAERQYDDYRTDEDEKERRYLRWIAENGVPG